MVSLHLANSTNHDLVGRFTWYPKMNPNPPVRNLVIHKLIDLPIIRFFNFLIYQKNIMCHRPIFSINDRTHVRNTFYIAVNIKF